MKPSAFANFAASNTFRRTQTHIATVTQTYTHVYTMLFALGAVCTL